MNLDAQDIVVDLGIEIARHSDFDLGRVDMAFLETIAPIIQELVNNTPVNSYVTFPEAMV